MRISHSSSSSAQFQTLPSAAQKSQNPVAPMKRGVKKAKSSKAANLKTTIPVKQEPGAKAAAPVQRDVWVRQTVKLEDMKPLPERTVLEKEKISEAVVSAQRDDFMSRIRNLMTKRHGHGDKFFRKREADSKTEQDFFNEKMKTESNNAHTKVKGKRVV